MPGIPVRVSHFGYNSANGYRPSGGDICGLHNRILGSPGFSRMRTGHPGPRHPPICHTEMHGHKTAAQAILPCTIHQMPHGFRCGFQSRDSLLPFPGSRRSYGRQLLRQNYTIITTAEKINENRVGVFSEKFVIYMESRERLLNHILYKI